MTLFSTLAAAVVVIPVLALAGLSYSPSSSAAPSAGSVARSADSLGSTDRATAAGRAGPGPQPGRRPGASTDPGRRQVWRWPLLPIPAVVRGFQLGPTPWSPGHRGVDLAARPGDVIRAPADGVVRFAGVLAGRPVLAIGHTQGLVSSFEPALSRLRPGTVVRQGEAVATVAPGQNHCLPETCLHWGVRRNGRYLDPLSLLPGRRGPAVLLPMPLSSEDRPMS